MNLDFALILVIGVFALWGAFAGFARQLAQVVGAIAAWWAARPAAEFWAPWLDRQTGWGPKGAAVAATVVTFLAIYLLVRWVVTSAVQRVLAGKDPQNRSTDRLLGFVTGGAKIFGLAWLALSALTYVEEHITIRGRRPFSLPSDALSVRFAREHNLFDYLGTRVEPNMSKLLETLTPKNVAALVKNPHLEALRKNPSVAPLFTDRRVQESIEKGKWSDLANNPTVQRALSDPSVLEHLQGLSKDLGGNPVPPR